MHTSGIVKVKALFTDLMFVMCYHKPLLSIQVMFVICCYIIIIQEIINITRLSATKCLHKHYSEKKSPVLELILEITFCKPEHISTTAHVNNWRFVKFRPINKL